ncbi:cytokine-like nuclear factor N-PAC [Anthonomus grandis grandis]|uniref:cytokine-like nuclear factor N-PAC n=1 Tax=Anthonomus grandis grandis TaxID=2921223 RepID=UPI0021650EF4|nr:cytokine-like nuclear factor N-PAC [Anthonomus grandis grandis]
MQREITAFRPGDFVWAKITGHPYWPSMILDPDPNAPPRTSPDMYWVYFFSSNNYSWVREKYVKDYVIYKNLYKRKLTKAAQEAYEKLEYERECIREDPNHIITLAAFRVQERRAPSVRSRRSNAGSTTSRRPRSRAKVRSASRASNAISEVSSRQPSPSNVSTTRKRKSLATANQGYEESDPALSAKISRLRYNLVSCKIAIGVIAGNLAAEYFVKNLIAFEHNVLMWSPSKELCNEVREYATSKGAQVRIYKDVRELAKRATIIIDCLSTEKEVLAILHELGLDDLSDDTLIDKFFIESTNIDYETSCIIHHNFKKKNTIYIEAMIQGTIKECKDRENTIFVGGSPVGRTKTLLEHYKSFFWAIGSATYLVGEVGAATKIQRILQAVKAVNMAGICEIMSLAKHLGLLKNPQFVVTMQKLSFNCPYFNPLWDNILRNKTDFVCESIQGFQQDLKAYLEMSNKLSVGVPLAATAHQIFKHARRLGLEDKDASVLFMRSVLS